MKLERKRRALTPTLSQRERGKCVMNPAILSVGERGKCVMNPGILSLGERTGGEGLIVKGIW